MNHLSQLPGLLKPGIPKSRKTNEEKGLNRKQRRGGKEDRGREGNSSFRGRGRLTHSVREKV